MFPPFKKKKQQKTLYINLTVIEMNNIIKGKQKLAILFLSFFFVCLCFHLTYYNARCLAKIKNFLSTYYTIPEKHLKKQRVVDEFPDHFECAPKINPW